ncbi:MAG: ABC transporter ATP-binding protein [Actinomycetota bacterium]
MSLLEVRSVTKRFGGLDALLGVSLELTPGGALGLIGPNGSGKTTLMNVLSGVYRPDRGEVFLQGESIVGLPPYELVHRGVARTFQAARVFQTVTVAQNMMIPVLHGARSQDDGTSLEERAGSLLDLVGLADRRHQAASELSGGQKRLLEFARAMMTRPSLVLMDEPFAGVHPEIKEQLIASIDRMRRDGTAFVVVSHEIPVITRLAEELVCLANGRPIARGSAEEVTRAPDVIEAYLGHRRQAS